MYSSTSHMYKVSALHNARQGRCSINIPLGHSLNLRLNTLAVGLGNNSKSGDMLRAREWDSGYRSRNI